ncbi:MAG: hypothetical protein CMK32_07790 [Porticoccaceae bacterium]|nr:hypothetical protein [Porticoccaceae bacterium]
MRRFLFVWVPKTAGTSIYTAMAKHAGMVKLKTAEEAQEFDGSGSVTFGHICTRELLWSGFVPEYYWNEAFKFAVARSPYTRAASLYRYLTLHNRFAGSFVEFLNAVRQTKPPGLYNVNGLSQSNPQSRWLTDEQGKFVVDRLYRFEQLSALEQDMRNFLGNPKFRLSHENATRVQHGSIFTGEAVERIRDIYAEDFDRLGYDKDSIPSC